MIFKPMKKEDILRVLKGQENVIERAAKAQEAFFRSLSCPSCGGSVMPIVNPKQLFKEGEILPNCLGKCKSCGTEFEPYTGIQVTLPEI